jgi:hypothetical protein
MAHLLTFAGCEFDLFERFRVGRQLLLAGSHVVAGQDEADDVHVRLRRQAGRLVLRHRFPQHKIELGQRAAFPSFGEFSASQRRRAILVAAEIVAVAMGARSTVGFLPAIGLLFREHAIPDAFRRWLRDDQNGRPDCVAPFVPGAGSGDRDDEEQDDRVCPFETCHPAMAA